MKIDKGEVLRYLGYKSQILDEKISTQIDISIQELKVISRERFTYNVFGVEMKDFNVELSNSNLIFRGKDIYNHLRGCSKCAVMAVTLGVEVDKKIMEYSKIDLMKSLIMDACASTAIETICDNIEGEISETAKAQGLNITYRYSPGYGDFQLDIQADILNCLDTYRKIGLSTTENFILLPRKSVTAVIGFKQDKAIQKKNKCIECKSVNCNFREGECYFE
ncbi:methionine synthase [Clostridium sp.]|uniref:methionine synthase n=1 Tax=Clostridium sp. TaxID=1506 RepID=UPI003D6CE96B